jgi:hypothetical protein
MEYVPGAEVAVAAVVKLSVNVSLPCWPVIVPVNVGFAAPYCLVALLALKVSVAGVTVIGTVVVTVA